MTAEIPLPFTCQHEAYEAGATNDLGNAAPGWADPVTVKCFWWDPTSTEPLQGPTGGDTAIADRIVVVDRTVTVDQRDRFTFGDGQYLANALAHDYNHGPFGYTPNRLVVDLTRVV